MTSGDPSGESDEVEDPLDRLERNEKQGLQAFRYVLGSIAVMAALAAAIIAFSDVPGARCPEPGELCFDSPRVGLVVFPTLLGMILAAGSMWTTYNRWKRHIRWRPWLFATYAMWMATTACLLFTSSVAFVEIG